MLDRSIAPSLGETGETGDSADGRRYIEPGDPSFITGLLVRCDALASHRPSVAPSACLCAGRTRRWRASRGSADAGWFHRPRDVGATRGAAMLVAPASRRRWWCSDAGWFYRPRILIRPLCRSLPLFRTIPSAPAFWSVVTLWRPIDPASRHRRGHSWVDWKGCDHADGTCSGEKTKMCIDFFRGAVGDTPVVQSIST